MCLDGLDLNVEINVQCPVGSAMDSGSISTTEFPAKMSTLVVDRHPEQAAAREHYLHCVRGVRNDHTILIATSLVYAS
jgi:hypothetical protein